MLTCKIRWIDSNGHPTPDDNRATMFAEYHTAIWDAHPHPNNKIRGYSPDVQEAIPICEAHLQQVTREMRYENGGAWTFRPIVEPHVVSDEVKEGDYRKW